VSLDKLLCLSVPIRRCGYNVVTGSRRDDPAMELIATEKRTPLLIFAVIVAGVYATSIALAGRLGDLQGADAVAVGMALDMVVAVPLAFYVLLVRRRFLPLVALVPAVGISMLLASWILPPAYRQSLHILEGGAIALELGLVSFIAWRAMGALRRARRDMAADPLEQMRRAAVTLVENERAAGAIASEIAIFDYALCAWWSQPHAPVGTTPFTHHRRSGQAAIVFAFLLLMLAEGIAVHVLLLLWSVTAAWIFTATTVYGALWLVADYRATVLRPILVSRETILLRAGLRWTISVPRDHLAAITHVKPEAGKESLSLTFLATPTHWLILKEPVMAEGPYGFRRQVRAVGLRPDEPEDLERMLAGGGE